MRHPSSFVVTVFGLLALWPVVASSYGVDLVAKIMIYALLALSLELLVGSTGLVCFGQAAFFGIMLPCCSHLPMAARLLS
jgi:branched-chain amino acid transport system permease protein